MFVGSSKLAAKTDAAEAVIKSIVVSKMHKATDVPVVVNTEENVTPMEVPDDQADLNAHWVKVASFALHKLLSTWDEGTNLAERVCTCLLSLFRIVQNWQNFLKKLLWVWCITEIVT